MSLKLCESHSEPLGRSPAVSLGRTFGLLLPTKTSHAGRRAVGWMDKFICRSIGSIRRIQRILFSEFYLSSYIRQVTFVKLHSSSNIC